jgi:hypothetical protein
MPKRPKAGGHTRARLQGASGASQRLEELSVSCPTHSWASHVPWSSVATSTAGPDERPPGRGVPDLSFFGSLCPSALLGSFRVPDGMVTGWNGVIVT